MGVITLRALLKLIQSDTDVFTEFISTTDADGFTARSQFGCRSSLT
ncbi:hypothetical protein VHP8226_03835 [Vibrio hippocampi]|uniref:Uncharacterized protein n=1 Tax=Vibrio hippocampi TaxID=654686 RepID=A0ABM8ZNF9_9VIBR|nr:hypothetical protein VHP8226_03835 [Vibrio hippocampi]